MRASNEPAPEDVAVGDEFGRVHVYEPQRLGLPPMRSYLRELWRRREFAIELSRTSRRARHFNTVFGQLWLLINPLLLAVVYFTLVTIIRDGGRGIEFFAHLLAGLFSFTMFQAAVRDGVASVTGGGKLIMNTAFPRALLPIASVITALMQFLPTLPIYLVVHVAAGLPLSWGMLWFLPVLGALTLFSAGMAMLFSTLHVYFRDVRSFLPYLLRIWLYVSPVLFYVDDVPSRLRPIILLNPMHTLIGSITQALNFGERPSLTFLAISYGWAIAAVTIGGLLFMLKEREFAVRL